MCKKYGTAGQATDDNIIRRMRFTCWMTKATDTHSEYIIFIAFPRQQWLCERASMLRLFLYCLSYDLLTKFFFWFAFIKSYIGTSLVFHKSIPKKCVSIYVASSGRIIGEWWMGEDLEGSGRGPREPYRHLPGGTETSTAHLSEYRACRLRFEPDTSRIQVPSITPTPSCSVQTCEELS
jgi:hypothetical protein